ncbi:hypothetical protein M9458_003785, partial [Cirrhinus mrigala]
GKKGSVEILDLLAPQDPLALLDRLSLQHIQISLDREGLKVHQEDQADQGKMDNL